RRVVSSPVTAFVMFVGVSVIVGLAMGSSIASRRSIVTVPCAVAIRISIGPVTAGAAGSLRSAGVGFVGVDGATGGAGACATGGGAAVCVWSAGVGACSDAMTSASDLGKAAVSGSLRGAVGGAGRDGAEMG